MGKDLLLKVRGTIHVIKIDGRDLCGAYIKVRRPGYRYETGDRLSRKTLF